MDNFRQAVAKSKILKLDGPLLSKNYIFSAKTLHTEDLSTLLSTTFSSNFSCHFWNYKSFLTIVAQTLLAFDKSSPSKCIFSDFSLLALIFSKLLMSFFKQKVRFSSKFGGSLFSVIAITLLYVFSWNFICYWQKGPIKVKFFRLSTVPMIIN